MLSLRFPIMKNIIGIMNLIIEVINPLKTKQLAIMENYRKLWKIIIWWFCWWFKIYFVFLF